EGRFGLARGVFPQQHKVIQLLHSSINASFWQNRTMFFIKSYPKGSNEPSPMNRRLFPAHSLFISLADSNPATENE
ncbi:MAG: hypothetical protein ABSF34_04820, partial [Verrucomicrobiota bacterium]